MEDSLLDRLKRFDDERPGFPGEHWLVLSAALWLLARPSASPLARALSIAAALALVYRAASGRDGLAGWWSRTPWRRARARKAWTRDLDATRHVFISCFTVAQLIASARSKSVTSPAALKSP